MEIKILDKRLTLDMLKPATSGSAGIDLYACINNPVTLRPGETVSIPSGIAIHIKDMFYGGFVYPRSGLGSKNGIVLGNLTGVIDSDYTGEIMLTIWNRSAEINPPFFVIKPMMRIAQLVIQPVLVPNLIHVDEFSEETERGDGGFGSTGQ